MSKKLSAVLALPTERCEKDVEICRDAETDCKAAPRTGRFGEGIIPTVVRLWRSDTGTASVSSQLSNVSS